MPERLCVSQVLFQCFQFDGLFCRYSFPMVQTFAQFFVDTLFIPVLFLVPLQTSVHYFNINCFQGCSVGNWESLHLLVKRLELLMK